VEELMMRLSKSEEAGARQRKALPWRAAFLREDDLNQVRRDCLSRVSGTPSDARMVNLRQF